MKKLNYIMISPHFPQNFIAFSTRLKEAGVNVLGIAAEPYEWLPQDLKEALTEYYRVDDMEDYQQVYRAVAYLAFKHGKIDRIESHNEHWMELDAKLRTDFNVPGVHLDQLPAYKYKSGMKKVFIDHQIPAPKGRVFKDAADARKLAKKLGYPVVVKPDDGVGASDTWLLKDAQALDEFLAQRQDLPYIMEEAIDGDIVTFDGLTDQEGQIVCESSMAYEVPVLTTMSGGDDLFYYVDPNPPQDILDLGRQVVQAFQIKERFFHIEFFRVKKTGKLLALELNCRPPGGASVDMLNYAYDIDVYKAYAQVVTQNQCSLEMGPGYYTGYLARHDQLAYQLSQQDLEAKYGPAIVEIKRNPQMVVKVMGDTGYVVRTQTLDELVAIVEDFRRKK